MKTVVVGITGGIAAYKIPQLIRLLKAQSLDVEVILTQSAKNFVRAKEITRITGHKVFKDLFVKNFDYQKVLRQRKVDHIDLADKADLVVIVPATANLLAKLAYGLADDFLTTTVLATKAPVIICPAMNVNMWQHPAVKANLDKVQALGYEIIPPVAGMLACGYEGLGRLEDLEKIAAAIKARLKTTTSLKGKRILITAGATREPIDSLRFITNPSSGKMGVALARAAARRGAEVKLLLAQRDFVTANQLVRLVKRLAAKYDIMFHTAAVGDFSPEPVRKGKLSSKKQLTLRLQPTLKILSQIKKFNPKICLVGFKADFGVKPARLQPDVDATVINDVSRKDIGFASDNNEVRLVLPGDQVKKIAKASKAVVAERLIAALGRYYHW
ncbi:MAG TPA: bifunctional phosphopantothenoylcysteine decarboxylase/phosphopantothenate--cysteine ligase CoaBC [Patescibacteria group bacterium]|nr:bifunctional phosphopantothenoylcysteine decarboxylase/phosphopantothenate--cysteine ligase CoaBC [Patescibacteria group bacterium]